MTQNLIRKNGSNLSAYFRMSILNKCKMNWPKSCSNCGSFSDYEGLFCKVCLNVIYSQRSFEKHEHPTHRGIPIYSFFNWEKDESRLKNILVVGLKGSKSKSEWGYWSYEFFREKMKWSQIVEKRENIENFQRYSQKYVFIPVPGSGQDHAWNFANYLSEIYGGEICSAFSKKKVQKIKKLSLRERKDQLYLEFNENLTKNWSSDITLILVDDVLTTGTTTGKMIEKLSDWKIEVWVLVSRRIVAPSPQ